MHIVGFERRGWAAVRDSLWALSSPLYVSPASLALPWVPTTAVLRLRPHHHNTCTTTFTSCTADDATGHAVC